MNGSVFALAAILILQAVLFHFERRELYRMLNGEREKPSRGKVENPISLPRSGFAGVEKC